MILRKLILPLLLIGLIGVVAGCQETGDDAGGEPMAPESEVDFATAVDAIRTDFTQAVAQGDGATAAALYTADAITYRPDGSMGSGTEGIAAAYQELFEVGFNAVTIEPMETIQHGDWGWEIGAYTYTGQSAEGDSLSLPGEYSLLLMQEDGMWKIHRSVAFATRAPASDEAMAGGEDMPMAGETQAEVMPGIQALLDQFTQAIAQSDGTAAAAVYTAEGKHYDGDGTTASGAEAIAAVYQDLFDAGFNAVTIAAVATTHHGDAAWQIGRSTFTGESEEGAALMLKGEYAILLMQEDGMWKVHRLVTFAPRHAPSDDDMTSDEM